MKPHARLARIVLRTLIVVAVLVLVQVPAPPVVRAANVVNSLLDNGPGNCATTCTLRDAVATANAGDTITFSVTGTINLGSTLTLLNTVTIQGPGAGQLIVRNQPHTGPVFQVNGGVNATFSGVTISNGAAALGGGIFSSGGTVTVRTPRSAATRPAFPAPVSTSKTAR
jgi:CSLREA domain-containing protein